jgi:GH43 family beta-xylosidase
MGWTYENPVWPGYFADPFVLRARGAYYAYGTGPGLERDASGAPRAFRILRSPDLVRWEEAGAALMVAPGETERAYWAPEVAGHEGRFYCYYSSAPAGQEEQHRLRVAVADSPLGPFEDRGPVLPEGEGFSIDAHPFRDPADGAWYLYYAKDYFDGRVGTGLAAVRLTPDLLRAANPPREILRANHDWQIYQRERIHYGRTWDAWHTVEGPCVIAHDGRYHLLYSGGNWRTERYGLGHAVAEHPLGPWTHSPSPGPLVLRQKDGEALGPGHNSHTVAPDGTEMIVYHAWNAGRTRRQMRIDPLLWTPDGPRVAGPSTGPVHVGGR